MRHVVSAIALVIAVAACSAWAQETDIMAGIFTEEQAQRGAELYARTCAGCHGAELVSSDPDFPTLAAPAFRWSWGGKPLGEKFEKVKTMPPNAKGSFSDQEYLDMVAYILHFNGYPAGEEELTPEAPLDDIVVTPQT